MEAARVWNERVAEARATARPWDRDLTSLIARTTLAVVILPHGLQKAFGWFGGPGFEGTLAWFTQSLGIPGILAVLVVATETLGSVALVVGLGSRLVGLSLAVIMTVAIATVHGAYGFFMNWGGDRAGEGFEFHLLVIGLALVVATIGSGRWSLDRWVAARWRRL